MRDRLRARYARPARSLRSLALAAGGYRAAFGAGGYRTEMRLPRALASLGCARPLSARRASPFGSPPSCVSRRGASRRSPSAARRRPTGLGGCVLVTSARSPAAYGRLISTKGVILRARYARPPRSPTLSSGGLGGSCPSGGFSRLRLAPSGC